MAVLDTARGAFVHGMQLTSGIAAIIAIGLALLTVLLLRTHNVPPSDPDAEAESESEARQAPAEQVAHIAPTQFGSAEG
jgi:hypothetical protein